MCSQPYSTPVFEPQKPDITSEVTRRNPLRLIVALSQSGTAWGDLFWDDGESLDTFERGSYSYLVFNVTQVGHGGESRGGGGMVSGDLELIPSPPAEHLHFHRPSRQH